VAWALPPPAKSWRWFELEASRHFPTFGRRRKVRNTPHISPSSRGAMMEITNTKVRLNNHIYKNRRLTSFESNIEKRLLWLFSFGKTKKKKQKRPF
jgi:hypothetical protein